MSEAVTMKGFRFKVKKYRIILHWKYLDYSNGMYGRTIIFPWVKWLLK